jgi:hypothetical protein
MVNSISLLGGKIDNSFGNTSANSCTTGRFSNNSSMPLSFNAKIAYSFHPLRMIFRSCREEMNLKEAP